MAANEERVPFPTRIAAINWSYKNLERMVRPPILKWGTQPEALLETQNPKAPNPYDTAHVRIFSVTWNMEGRLPRKEDLKNLLYPDVVHHDIFCIGS